MPRSDAGGAPAGIRPRCGAWDCRVRRSLLCSCRCGSRHGGNHYMLITICFILRSFWGWLEITSTCRRWGWELFEFRGSDRGLAGYEVAPALARIACLHVRFVLRKVVAINLHVIKDVIMRDIDRRGGATEVVTGPVRSEQRSGWRGKLLDGSCDPAPGIVAVVIAVCR